MRDVLLRPVDDAARPRDTVLYFPPSPDGRPWLLDDFGDRLVVPPHVEVRIAPGARVVPVGRDSVLEIQGVLSAPVAPVFAPRTVASAGAGGATVGAIELTNPRLKYVHPEWWGAGSGEGDEVDTRALEEAVRVAFLSAGARRPLVIELLGRYVLTRTILVRAGMAQERAEFRGRHGSPDDPTFRCADSFRGESLFDVEAIAACFRAVRFDAGGKAASCLRIALEREHDPTQLPHLLERCVFRGARRVLVDVAEVPDVFEELSLGSFLRVNALRVQAPYDANLSAVGPPRVEVAGCLFLGPEPFMPTGFIALGLSGPQGASTVVRNCTFVGAANAMIYASSHDVTVTSCRFDNTMPPRPSWAIVPDATDIFLDAMSAPEPAQIAYGLAPPYPAPLADLLTTPRSPGDLWRRIDVSRALPRGTWFIGARAAATAQDCRSTGPRFLTTAPGASAALSPDSVIIGLHHAYVPPPGRSLAFIPPAIEWGSAEHPVSEGAVHLIGCRFDNLRADGDPRIAAHSSNAAPAVYDYGITSQDTLVATPSNVGNPGGVTPGMYNRGVRLGFVPRRP